MHHGAKRESKPKYLSREDVVITTYNIVSSEHKTNGALFGVKWNRIILDEAHIIRNHKTAISVACSDLRGKYRWVLTGTPICNKEMDVFALLRFLKVRPFDDYQTYKRWLEDKRGGGGVRLHALIKTILLRRTKALLQEKQVLELPPKELMVIEVGLMQDEKNVYSKVLAYSRTLFTEFLVQKGERTGEYVSSNTFGKPSREFDKMHEKFARFHGGSVKAHEILVLLLRLRQICVHPGLIDAVSILLYV